MDRQNLVDTMDKMKLESNQKTRLLYSILNSEQEEVKPTRIIKRRFVTAMVIVLVSFLTATTVLAVSLGWHEKLIEYFNPTEEQLSKYSGAADDIQATVTKNGVTINVLQTLADSRTVYVIYDLILPDNVKLSMEVGDYLGSKMYGMRWEMCEFSPEVDQPGSYTFSWPLLLEKEGNRYTFMQHVTHMTTMSAGKATLTFSNLGYFTEGTEDVKFSEFEESEFLDEQAEEDAGKAENNIKQIFIPIIEGDWKLEFDYQYEDTGIEVDVNQPLSINGSEHNIRKIAISPFSAYFYIEGQEISSEVQPSINFKDGRIINYIADYQAGNLDSGPWQRGENFFDEFDGQMMTFIAYQFNEMIDPEDVESISFGDVTIPFA